MRVVDRAYGFPMDIDEHAVGPLAGGILQHGYQCGMLWGAVLAAGAEAFRRFGPGPTAETAGILAAQKLVEMYFQSVGRNSTLILGATPDRQGLMPEADLRQLREMGRTIAETFSNPLAVTEGQGSEVRLDLSRPARVGHLVLQEDIRSGERVRRYTIEGNTGADRWQKLDEGTCVGHKRIVKIDPIEVASVVLRIDEAVAEPLIRSLALFP